MKILLIDDKFNRAEIFIAIAKAIAPTVELIHAATYKKAKEELSYYSRGSAVPLNAVLSLFSFPGENENPHDGSGGIDIYEFAAYIGTSLRSFYFYCNKEETPQFINEALAKHAAALGRELKELPEGQILQKNKFTQNDVIRKIMTDIGAALTSTVEGVSPPPMAVKRKAPVKKKPAIVPAKALVSPVVAQQEVTRPKPVPVPKPRAPQWRNFNDAKAPTVVMPWEPTLY